MIVFNRYFLAIAMAATAAATFAQPTARPAPSDPAAAAPAVGYESAFSGYVPHRDPEIAPWRDVNDQAARIGGHAGTLRQSGMHGGQPVSPSSIKPVMPGHGGR